MNQSIFCISLDFELHWGGFEKWPLEEYKPYFDRTRESIPTILSLFAQQKVHTTWATVGMLLHKDLQSLEANFPDLKPSYTQEQLSAYHFIKKHGVGTNEEDDPYHYADSLIQQIVETPGQELATHSFAHYYCNEEGQTLDEFREDLKAAKVASKAYVNQIESLVFPRNQFNEKYLEVCSSQGLGIVRSNPTDWWWKIDSTQAESKWKRLNRGVDAYFGIGGKTSYKLHEVQKQQGVYLLPASRLLRPYNPKELFLNKVKVSRIKKEMTRAAKNNEVYHLWWHPHNFGNHTQKNIDGLMEIINHFASLNKTYGMTSLSMGEILNILK